MPNAIQFQKKIKKYNGSNSGVARNKKKYSIDGDQENSQIYYLD
jgi:hypothetical protein